MKINENGIHLIDLLCKHANRKRRTWQKLDKRIQFNSECPMSIVEKGFKNSIQIESGLGSK